MRIIVLNSKGIVSSLAIALCAVAICGSGVTGGGLGAFSGSNANAQTCGVGCVNTSWAQPAWYIDPANVSGAANDANNCTARVSPCLTWGAITTRWGGISPHFTAATTITWMSSQASPWHDPVYFEPYQDGPGYPSAGNNGLLYFVGDLSTNQQVSTGTLGAVTLISPNVGQLEQVNFTVSTGSLAVGDLILNTSHSPQSAAIVYKSVSGTTYSLSQPIQHTFGGNMGDVPGYNWANGDNYIAYKKVDVDLREFKTHTSNTTQSESPDNSAIIRDINIASNIAGAPLNGATKVRLSEPLLLQEVSSDKLVDYVISAYNPGYSGGAFQNCWLPLSYTSGGDLGLYGKFQTILTQGWPAGPEIDGGIMAIWGAGAIGMLGSNVIVYAGGGGADANIGQAHFRGVYVDTGTTIHVNELSRIENVAPAFWGPGKVDVAGNARLTWETTVAANTFGSLTGGFTINGQTTAYQTGGAGSLVTINSAGLQDAGGGSCNTNDGLYAKGGGSIICAQVGSW